MDARFEKAFLEAVKKHAAIKKQVEKKVRMIMDHPTEMGEPLKGNWRGFFSCPVRRNFIIIYLYCRACRKMGNDAHVACSDCALCPDDTIKFVLLGVHDEAYGRKRGKG